MSAQHRLAAFAMAMILATPAFAQTKTGTSATTASASASTAAAGAFQSLSPGDKKIAHALFEAQQPTANGPAPLNLDQIAALKSKNGWGKAFKHMKAEGLVSEKNLGQVVSADAHTSQLPSAGSAKTPGIAMTTGNGRVITASAERGTARN